MSICNINVNLTMKQKNELITGIALAAELPASSSKYKKYLTVCGYQLDVSGKKMRMDKFLNSTPNRGIRFRLHCYELPIEYIENDWWIGQEELINRICIDEIEGIENLEHELSKFLKDFSKLLPEWKCSYPL